MHKLVCVLGCLASVAHAQQLECKFSSCKVKGHVDQAVIAALEKQPKRETLNVYLSDNASDADLAAVARLTWITGLQIWGDATTLAPLSSLKHLRDFGYHSAKITTLAPLAGLTELESVDFNNAKLTDATALRGATKLKYLDLQYNKISDVSLLADMKALERLNVSGVKAADWKALAGKPNLRMLWIFGANVGDADLFAASTKLEELNACDAGLEHIRPLAKMTALSKLDLSHNEKLSDLSPLAKLTGLDTVDVTHTAVRDLSPLLASAKSLTSVKAPKAVKPSSVAALKKQNPEIKIELDGE